MNALKIGFIGGGKMAQAMAGGFIKSGLVQPSQILVSDISQHLLKDMEKLDVGTTLSNRQVVQKNDLVFLAVKPNMCGVVLKDIKAELSQKKLLVSIAAGINIDTMENHLPRQARVIRVMPNMPALVQSAVCVFSRGQYANEQDGVVVRQLLESIGIVEEMPEYLMDAATGLSGSGPAYAFLIMQSLADGGVMEGLPRHQATRMTAQSMLGAAKVLLETDGHPEALKDSVCSPGGTSIYGVQALEDGGIRATLINAVSAATRRARELGQMDDDEESS